MEQPTGYVLAVDAVLRHVNSARPDAPVRPERPRAVPLAAPRLAVAAVLRRVADRIQPAPVPRAPRCS
ncbi:hypothetical protein [Micromonospora endolithica]|uniref:Uncharacterized protein n=1 Tax=Micromonospora endolithica TaxID=230091 RepID=A0A3A9ZUQ3_9ACTN|nr:hypothetical protein [Micromonospora endolithica]RKN51127.1 hypothetical protein D7223_05310 [Micromonospora endolithica]TWJ22328.1 hypothetical protein JD76_02443 [Micromonospora endolithica]